MLHSFCSELTDSEQPELLLIGGGGNCFSFGTHFNPQPVTVDLRPVLGWSVSMLRSMTLTQQFMQSDIQPSEMSGRMKRINLNYLGMYEQRLLCQDVQLLLIPRVWMSKYARIHNVQKTLNSKGMPSVCLLDRFLFVRPQKIIVQCSDSECP